MIYETEKVKTITPRGTIAENSPVICSSFELSTQNGAFNVSTLQRNSTAPTTIVTEYTNRLDGAAAHPSFPGGVATFDEGVFAPPGDGVEPADGEGVVPGGEPAEGEGVVPAGEGVAGDGAGGPLTGPGEPAAGDGDGDFPAGDGELAGEDAGGPLTGPGERAGDGDGDFPAGAGEVAGDGPLAGVGETTGEDDGG